MAGRSWHVLNARRETLLTNDYERVDEDNVAGRGTRTDNVATALDVPDAYLMRNTDAFGFTGPEAPNTPCVMRHLIEFDTVQEKRRCLVTGHHNLSCVGTFVGTRASNSADIRTTSETLIIVHVDTGGWKLVVARGRSVAPGRQHADECSVVQAGRSMHEICGASRPHVARLSSVLRESARVLSKAYRDVK